jgi:hypothetical protein
LQGSLRGSLLNVNDPDKGSWKLWKGAPLYAVLEMFGYVTADKPNMLMKDYADYRAYYCGLCKTLGKRYNQLMRFSINYDITFLSLIAHNYLKFKPTIKHGRCVAHPVGKKFPIVLNNEIQEKIADVNIILGYYKALDDVLDDGGFKYKFACAMLKDRFKVAKKRLPKLAQDVKTCYEDLRTLEKNKEPSLDKLSHCFATMLQHVGEAVMPNINDNLLRLCYNLGRWIYLIDAFSDLEDDFKCGAFNPFIPNGELTDEIKNAVHEIATFTLKTAVAEIRDAYDKMEVTVTEGALSNVVYLGLRTRTETVLNKVTSNK